MFSIKVTIVVSFMALAPAEILAHDASNTLNNNLVDRVLNLWHHQARDVDDSMLAKPRAPPLSPPRSPTTLGHPGRFGQMAQQLPRPPTTQFLPQQQFMKQGPSQLSPKSTPTTPKIEKLFLPSSKERHMRDELTQLNQVWKKSADEWTAGAAVTKGLKGSGLAPEWGEIQVQARATAEAAEEMLPWWCARLDAETCWTQLEEAGGEFAEAARAWESAAQTLTSTGTDGWRGEVAAAVAIAAAARATSSAAVVAHSEDVAGAWLNAAQAWDSMSEFIVSEAAEETQESLMKTIHEEEHRGEADTELEWYKEKAKEQKKESIRMEAKKREMLMEWKKGLESENRDGEDDEETMPKNQSPFIGGKEQGGAKDKETLRIEAKKRELQMAWTRDQEREKMDPDLGKEQNPWFASRISANIMSIPGAALIVIFLSMGLILAALLRFHSGFWATDSIPVCGEVGWLLPTSHEETLLSA